ncbi:hypothetical protein FRC03_000460 [Tulasnella sp. 419]|nr:hypothetical protein FRC03_000460 [Tulasnella sp. 419]
MLRSFVLLACVLAAQFSNAQSTISYSATLAGAATGISLPAPCSTGGGGISLGTYYFKSSPSNLSVGKLTSGAAALKTLGLGGGYEYTNSFTGSYFGVPQSCKPTLYLSVDEGYPHSYKPLVWTTEQHTSYWVIAGGSGWKTKRQMLQGGSLITTSSSPYGVVGTFLACGANKQLFLQTGTDTPAGIPCTIEELVMEVYW